MHAQLNSQEIREEWAIGSDTYSNIGVLCPGDYGGVHREVLASHAV